MHSHSTALFLILVIAACSSPMTDIDPAYRAEIEDAWAAREAALTADNGWLTLTGLYWLEPGPNTLGSAEGSDVRLPDGAKRAGVLTLYGDGAVTLSPAADAGLTINDDPATDRELTSDAEGSPDIVQSGRARFYLIARGNRIGVRVKDPDAATRRDFSGLDRYPIDPTYQVLAVFEPYESPREVTIPTVIGEPATMLAPGLLRFGLNGKTLSLEPYIGEPGSRDLFIVFRDTTSGDTTYGAGRFLSAELPADGNEVVLDFNLAVNPPCAFTPYATCPLPTPENTLPVPIEAGEEYSGESH